MTQRRIGLLGGGAWGTAIAVHLARRGFSVRQWIREAEVVEQVRRTRMNELFLPGVRIPDQVTPCGEPSEVLERAEMLVAVVPSPYAREVYRRIRDELPAETPLVVATKGIEESSLGLPLQVAAEELGQGRRYAVVSGPSFAAEVARECPTALVAASSDSALARRIQADWGADALRIYTNGDPVGVQLAGALKNVFAIAAGVADGLGSGLNSRAALITRGLAEMSRLGRRLGGDPSTFAGLAGLGDLVLTCTGALSRNHAVGERLGQGESLQAILEQGPTVPEGVRTTRSAYRLAAREGIGMPIVEEVHRMLFGGGSPGEALSRLMSRPPTSEGDA